MKELGARLQKLRRQAGMSQQDWQISCMYRANPFPSGNWEQPHRIWIT